jgi:hypothetical protein
MAIPGSGFRLANDALIEASLRLVQPFVYTTLLGAVTPGSQTVLVGSLGIPTNACYVGAQLLVQDSVNGNEIVTLTGFNTTGPTITAVFAFSHPIATVVSGATWPLQQATDPVFTQSEMLSYLSRAQNEFLSQCPVVYATSSATALYNTLFYAGPANFVELERISLSQLSLSGVTLTRNGTGTVTAVFGYNHGLIQNQTFTVYNSLTDQTFLGAFSVATVVSPTEITYPQYGAASSATGSLGLFLRLLESNQEEITMQERTWLVDTSLPPTAFYEDRSGNYNYGLNVRPQGNFPMNLLYSIRDTDTLTLADGFIAPDIFVPYILYKFYEFCYSKDGVWSNPQLAKYAKMRFEKGVAITNRFFMGEQGGAMSLGEGRRK